MAHHAHTSGSDAGLESEWLLSLRKRIVNRREARVRALDIWRALREVDDCAGELDRLDKQSLFISQLLSIALAKEVRRGLDQGAHVLDAVIGGGQERSGDDDEGTEN